MLGAALAFSLSAASRAEAVPAHTDVLFVFDTTGSLGGALTESAQEMQVVMAQVSASLPDAQFGLAETKDYPEGGVINNPDSSLFEYGDTEDVPWKLISPITFNRAAVEEGLLKLDAGGGGDSPESYGRALYESVNDPGVAWRPGARGVIVLIADDVPHDRELNQGVPGATVESPFDTGPDPGRDNTVGTGDDLDWQDVVLPGLSLSGKPLEYVHYQGVSEYVPYWQHWASLSGGSAVPFEGKEGESIVNALVDAIKRGADAALPACPAGQMRDPSEKCVPSNRFELVPRISCSKGCRVVIVKVTFDSAGNVVAESIPEEEGKASGATASAKAKCGKKAKKVCKKPRLIKKLEQPVVAGENTLKLKLTGAALKTLKKKGKLNLKVTYTHTPTGGFAATSSQTYKVKLPKKKKKAGAKK